jgi:hypothetical protein
LRRIDLPRPQREQQREAARPVCAVDECVARQRLRRVALAVGRGFDVEREGVVAPVHRGHRQVAVAQRLRGLHVGPGQRPAAVDLHRGFDADAAAADLDGTVFGQQGRALAAAIDSDQRPVVLLAEEGAR